MKRHAFLAGMFAFLAVAAIAQDAPGPQGLRLTYDVSGLPLTITRDAAGVVQVDGLSYPGFVLYRPATKVVYYQHPDEPTWLTIPPEAIADYGVKVTAVAGKPWQPYLDAPTQRWEIRAAQISCDNWFASSKAGAVAGLNAGDIQRILTAMQWLHAGKAAIVCEKLAVKEAAALKIGLPLYFSGPGGQWQLIELGQANVDPIPLPTTPTPVDDAARLRILLYQFGSEERAAIMDEIGHLPLARQLDEIQGRLAEHTMY